MVVSIVISGTSLETQIDVLQKVLGWGAGVHACAGMRWAKLQQTIIVAYALAMFEWRCCDANGEPDPHVKHRRLLDSDSAFHLPPAYAKLSPRQEL
jgi:hypothetical protein